MCGENLTVGDCLWIDVDHRVRKHTTRNVFEDAWFHDVNSGEHQRQRFGSAVYRHTAESLYSTSLSFHDAEAFVTSVGKMNECRDCVRVAMSLEGRS